MLPDGNALGKAASPGAYGVVQAWQALFAEGRMGDKGVVVEVGPGFSTKVGQALARTGFQGDLFLVEPCREALRRTARRYASLLPAARIFAVPRPLAESFDELPPRVDALVMNHVLDDLVLSRGMCSADHERVFSSFSGALVDKQVRSFWRQLAPSRQRDRLVRWAISAVADGIDRIAPDFLGISHYASWVHVREQLVYADQVGIEVLEELQSLASPCSRSRALLGDLSLPPSRWMVRLP